jgi:S-adenosylmethionine decarboxylase
MPILGTHTLAEFYECDPVALDNLDMIRQVLLEAAQRAGATIVGNVFHRFLPQGVTGVVLLAESHVAIHTWPECRYAAVDLFTCGKTMLPEACLPYLVEELRSSRHTTTRIIRGEISDSGERH